MSSRFMFGKRTMHLYGAFEESMCKDFVIEKEISEDNTMQVILPIKPIINKNTL